jgi:biopolymer transport protein ExbB
MARPRFAFAVLAALGLSMIVGVIAPAQEPKTKPAEPTATKAAAKDAPPTRTVAAKGGPGGVNRESILRLFSGANPMMWLLGLCSIVTLGFALERVVALRRSRVIPKDFVERFHERLSGGKLDRDRAIELCRANDSAAARIFAHVVRYWGMPAAAIRQAVEADAAGEIVDLKRHVRVLNGTSTLAPLLGLLGTVVGMIESFDALGSKAGGDKSAALAQGISLALVSTAIGLGVAIISVAMYYFLLNKVDVLVRDLDEQARRVIDLVSAEAIRPPADRRTGFAGDHTRHESRIH